MPVGGPNTNQNAHNGWTDNRGPGHIPVDDATARNIASLERTIRNLQTKDQSAAWEHDRDVWQHEHDDATERAVAHDRFDLLE